jgi:hypothetical protein
MPPSWCLPGQLPNVLWSQQRRLQRDLCPHRTPRGTTTKSHSLGIHSRPTRVRHYRHCRLQQRCQRRSLQASLSNRPPNAKGARGDHLRRRKYKDSLSTYGPSHCQTRGSRDSHHLRRPVQERLHEYLVRRGFYRDSKLVLDLSSRKYGFNYAPGSWYPFLPSTTPGSGMDTIDAIFQEMKVPSLIEPLADNDARDYQSPTSGITQPAIHDGRGVWNVYQARGSSDYIMQDAADALMDYEMESSSGNDSPIRIHLATLHLRPVEGASLPEIEQERLNALLDQHVELFAKTGPPTPFAEHQIDTGDSTPIASPPYRLTPGKRQILQVEINAMLEAGIIEECESAWASPAVLVPKPDGSIPVCVDYRRLNAVTKPDMYPLPRMDDLLNAIGPIGCISTLDLQAGYWQIQIRSEDRDKTALVCPFGLYRFLRMPFGLRNAPASFQRLIDRFKTGLPDVILLA